MPFLPSNFAADTRVDAGVLRSFKGLVEERRKALRRVLELPADIGVSGLAPADDLLLRRILATDAALRWLLASPTPVKYEDVRSAHFNAREGDLLRLGAAHIALYNHDAKTLELESELMRRVVAVRLGSAD